jgi:hypothetical protein
MQIQLLIENRIMLRKVIFGFLLLSAITVNAQITTSNYITKKSDVIKLNSNEPESKQSISPVSKLSSTPDTALIKFKSNKKSIDRTKRIDKIQKGFFHVVGGGGFVVVLSMFLVSLKSAL